MTPFTCEHIYIPVSFAQSSVAHRSLFLSPLVQLISSCLTMSKQTDITKWSVVTKAQGSRWSSPVQETPELAVWAHVELTDDEDEPVPTRVPSPLPLPPSPPIDPRDIPWLSAANGASSSSGPPAVGDDILSWQSSLVNEADFDLGEGSADDGVDPEIAMPNAVTPKPTRRRTSIKRGRPADCTGEGDIVAGRTSPRGRTRSRTRARTEHRLRRMNAKDFADVVPLISYGDPDAESSSVTATVSLGSEAVTSDVAATAIDSEDVPGTAAENDGVRPRRFLKRKNATVTQALRLSMRSSPSQSSPSQLCQLLRAQKATSTRKKNAAEHAAQRMHQPHVFQPYLRAQKKTRRRQKTPQHMQPQQCSNRISTKHSGDPDRHIMRGDHCSHSMRPAGSCRHTSVC